MQSIKITAFVLLLASLTMTSCSNDNDETINGETPSEISAFMNEYYPSQDFVVSEDLDDGVLTYEVDVENGVELEFDENGTLTSIDGNTSEESFSMIDQNILDYVNSNFPNESISEWDFDGAVQTVELDNGLELVFDAEGNFMHLNIDDDLDSSIVIDSSELPESAQAYISDNFSNDSILKATKELDDSEITYEVVMQSNVELTFNTDGDIIEIDGNDQAINTNLIPQELVVYVNTNYPENYITSWDLDTLSQEVDLDNDYELTFDLNNQFISVDKD
ncbi:MAG: PepSY-like domain-containing protein [Flavobacteriaceae bacterium]